MSAWLVNYPEGVSASLPSDLHRSLRDLLEEAFVRYAERDALRFMGVSLNFAKLDQAAEAFASYLQSLGLAKGDRVALMMPNVFQYPVAVAAVVRAGLVVVNTNPLYTPRELEHQLADSGAKAIVVLENMAATLEVCVGRTAVEHVVITSVGDMLPFPKGVLVDLLIRRLKRLVPPYRLSHAVRWKDAMKRGRSLRLARPTIEPDDLCVLQYTGGTTGAAKGVMLTNRNIVANIVQSQMWNAPALNAIPKDEQPTVICALPLYHIFGFTVNMMLWLHTGGRCVLILNPRDISAVIKNLRSTRFHSFPAVNTLFAAIARHPDAGKVDWTHMRLAVGGGMAVQATTAERWQQLTGTPICEGYGLSEASPVAACNPVRSSTYSGTIGLPLPSTEMKIVADDESERAPGEAGEIVIRGPQVMAGYWNCPRETKDAMTGDGFFKTGDIGVMDENGRFRIVDRKKDMINVSGFNVYPNEIEAFVLSIPGIVEAAAIGVPDDISGEAVKLFVVTDNPVLTEADVKAFCRQGLTNYKRPRYVEFRDELPKSNIGKVLRRMLRPH